MLTLEYNHSFSWEQVQAHLRGNFCPSLSADMESLDILLHKQVLIAQSQAKKIGINPGWTGYHPAPLDLYKHST